MPDNETGAMLAFFAMMTRICDSTHPDRIAHSARCEPVVQAALQVSNLLQKAGFDFRRDDPLEPDSSVCLHENGIRIILCKEPSDPDRLRHDFYLAAVDRQGYNLGGLNLGVFCDPQDDGLTHSFLIHAAGDHDRANILRHDIGHYTQKGAERKFSRLLKTFLYDHIPRLASQLPGPKP